MLLIPVVYNGVYILYYYNISFAQKKEEDIHKYVHRFRPRILMYVLTYQRNIEFFIKSRFVVFR